MLFQAVKALNEKLQTTRNSFAPRPKFSFKSALQRRNLLPNKNPPADGDAASTTTTTTATSAAGGADSPPTITNGLAAAAGPQQTPAASPSKAQAQSQSQSLPISYNKSARLRLTEAEAKAVAGGSGLLQELERCSVSLQAEALKQSPFRDIRLSKITKSLVVVGRVDGPISIRNVEHSVVVVAAKQFRMFGCKDVDVYLHAVSEPVIEESHEIRFAPLLDGFVRWFPNRVCRVWPSNHASDSRVL
jgi:hypothetical protein